MDNDCLSRKGSIVHLGPLKQFLDLVGVGFRLYPYHGSRLSFAMVVRLAPTVAIVPFVGEVFEGHIVSLIKD